MKKHFYSIFAALLIFSFNASSQPNGPWVQTKNTPQKTFAEYQQEFNDYWEGKTPQKGQGYKQFKRWEYFWQSRLLKDGKLPTSAIIWEGIKEAKSKHIVEANRTVSQWIPMGPFDYTLTGSWSAGHGRVNTVVADPNESNTIYIGAPAGGIWKSTNAGQTWTVLNDQLGIIGVSAIAIDPDNSDIIYIGTGDDDAGDTFSIGIMKSTDGGENWNTTGLVLAGNSRVSNVLIDPDNSQVIYAATNSGLFKSENGGTSFSVILSVNIRDLSFKPGDSQTIYAVDSDFFYRSTNSGTSFDQISSGLPTSDVSRIVIGVSPAQPQYVYLLIADNSSGFKGMYRSMNSGSSFSLRNNTTDIFESSQAWYDLAIAVDPVNADIVYTGVLNLWKSTNGGSGFTQINSWSNPTGASYTHADIHFLGFLGTSLFCGSDGGVYKSTNGANNFTDLSIGLQIGQFYKIDGTEQNENAIVGGLQDNGGYYTQSGQGGWKNYFGADGMDCVIDPSNHDVIYGSIQFGSIYQSTDGGETSFGIDSPENGAWVTPIQIDPGDHARLLGGYSQLYEYESGSWNPLTSFDFGGDLNNIKIAPSNSDIIYLSRGSSLYKTINGGGSVAQLDGLPSGSITGIDIHDTNPNIVWVTLGGFSNGNKVFKSIDGGSSWTNISGSLPNLPTNCIIYQKNSNGGIYVGNDFGVYYYDEVLAGWIDYFADLPHTIVNDLVINYNTDVITAGTYGRGVWRSPLNNNVLLAVNPFLKSINSIDEIICDSIITPDIIVRNLGVDTLTGFTIEYGIGNFDSTYIWSGNLPSLSEITINLGYLIVNEGQETFQARITNPNGGTDDDPENNQKEVSFNSVPNGEAITIHLETDCWGSETSWEIRDANNSVIMSKSSFEDQTVIDDLSCLNEGCYQFIINDSYGDGMFGSQYSSCEIDGNYSLIDNQGNILVAMEQADFGFQAVHNFCIGDVPVSIGISSTEQELCRENSIDFQDLSLGSITSWSWEFEEGEPAASDLQNPTGILYSTPGSFDVTLTVIDNDGGSFTEIFTDYITILDNPQSTIMVVSDITCFGVENGSVELTASGGVPPYEFSVLDSINSSGVFEGLPTGNINYFVSDAQGCAANGSFTITEPAEIVTNLLFDSEILCYGANTASISFETSGGIPPYEYALNDSEFTGINAFDNLNSGNFVYHIRDANDCIINGDFELSEPDSISVTATIIDEIDGAANGSIDLSVSGGTAPYNFSWSNGSIEQDISGLAPGIYSVVISDANNCSTQQSYTISFTVGVNELLSGEIKVYPNPANHELFIELDQSYDKLFVELISDDGKVVRSRVTSGETSLRFNVSDLAKGSYLIRLTYQESTKMIKVLLVK